MSKRNVRLDDLMPLIRESLAQGRSVRFSPRGTSMLPMLRQGLDTVTLSPLPERKLYKYELPMYQRENGQFVIHRIIKAGETYTCMGDNQFQKEPGLTHEQMIALVTGFTRDGKEHSVEDMSHWFYCRFWHYSRPVRFVWRHVLWQARRILK